MKVPLRWRGTLRILRLLPQGVLSRAWGRLAAVGLPRILRGPVNRGFARLFQIDPNEAERPPEDYPSLSAFFVRRLREGTRSWPDSPDAPGSPVDGVLGSFGVLEAGTAFQAKRIRYDVSDLLAGDGSRFTSGLYFTIYLSPRHYHRIHAPLEASLYAARAVPGRLLPVNMPAVLSVSDLFPRNERLVALMRRGEADAALVAIGAYNVGSIEAAFDPEWGDSHRPGVTNRPDRTEVEERWYDPALTIERGRELMAFHLGSTVVLLLSHEGWDVPHPGLREGIEMRVGMPLVAGSWGGKEEEVRERSSSVDPEAAPGRR